MEIKEAVEALRFYQRKLYNGIYREKIGAFDVAISASEKQVGKKPYPDDDSSILACPYCGSGEYLHNLDGNVNQYCGQCGQKIDWSE